MTENGFCAVLEVRWSDLDANWHMRNTAYAEFGLQTRLEYLSRGGFPPHQFRELGFGPVIFREEARYLRELRLGDKVRISFVSCGLSQDGSRWALRHDLIRDDGETAAVLEIDGGWLDLETRRLRLPPDDLRALLEALPRTDGFETLKSVIRHD